MGQFRETKTYGIHCLACGGDKLIKVWGPKQNSMRHAMFLLIYMLSVLGEAW